MSYPTDPLALAMLTEDEWEALLAGIRANPAPVPRPIVRLMPLPDVVVTLSDVRLSWRGYDDDSEPVEGAQERLRAPPNRRAIALARIACGEKKIDIAKSFGISPSLLSKILSGIRN